MEASDTRLTVRISLPSAGKDKLINELGSVLGHQGENGEVIEINKVIPIPSCMKVWIYGCRC